jgi:endoribonuclease LACTB2
MVSMAEGGMGVNIVNVGYRSTNYYVLADSKPRLLVDAGWPGTLGMMQHACERMGVRLGDVPFQLVTHFHPDHAGLAEELKRLGVRLVVLDTQVAGIALLKGYVKSRDGYVEIQEVTNVVVTEEESRGFLAGIGIEGQIISTPGHSDDSATLILDDGAAFTGDLTPPMMVPEDAEDAAYRSWARIREKGARVVYPGHGPAWSV